MSASAPFPLDIFLAWLDPDRDRAGELYERARRRLVYYFEGRQFWNADVLADEVIDRVARRVAGGAEIPPASRDSFFLSTASYVAHEELRRQKRARPIDFELAALPARLNEEEVESRLGCLDRCLGELAPESQALIRRFYDGRGSEKLANRRGLAEELHVPAQALWSRVHRLRKKLETCIRDCIRAPEAA